MLRPLSVDFLILGAGWTSTFLIPRLQQEGITYLATSTTGHDSTAKFVFDPESNDEEPYKLLPSATTIMITFPLKEVGQSRHLTQMYSKVHEGVRPHWIQLGSTGIFTAPHWNDCTSDYDKTNARAIAEDELIELGGAVLNLAGLYGGARDPKSWLVRVAKSKEEVRGKKALHLIHGDDVAKGVIAMSKKFTPAKRWLLTDLHVYDWWDLAYSWGDEAQEKTRREGGGPDLEYRKWVLECMEEEDVRALPREKESLGRILDARAFWKTMGAWPDHPRVN